MDKLKDIAAKLRNSYLDGIGINPEDGTPLPRRDEILQLLEKLQLLIFPGFDRKIEKTEEILLAEIRDILVDLTERSFFHLCEMREKSHCNVADKVEATVDKFLAALPDIREKMKLDVAAAYIGDPAAGSYDEIVLSYPGVRAITIQRLAHVLYLENLPLIPRMMTEYAHSLTGIDIHPGAQLGKGIFIDHGTGVVVGETAELGDNVRIYQGVTLGALSFPKDACGMLIKGRKRHPSVGNEVIIYAGATVLGDIFIGDHSVIGGNVWVTESLPPGTKITARPPEHQIKNSNPAK